MSLKCLLGLLTPDQGAIEIDGASTLDISEDDRDGINRKFGMLFQHAALFDSMTVLDNVTFGLIRGKGMTLSEAADALSGSEELSLESRRWVLASTCYLLTAAVAFWLARVRRGGPHGRDKSS